MEDTIHNQSDTGGTFSSGEKHFLKFGIIFAVVLAVIAGAFILIGKSPLGKAMSSLFGGLAGIATAAGHQFATCNKVGYFNVSGGCYIGLFAIIFGVISVAGGLLNFYVKMYGTDGKATAQLKANEEISGGDVSQTEQIEKALDGVNTDKLNEEMTNSKGETISEDVKIAGLGKAVSKKIQEDGFKILDGQSLNPQEIQAKKAFIKTVADETAEAILNDLTDGMDSDESKTAEDNMNDAATQFVDPVD